MEILLTYEQQADAWASVPADEWDAICRAQVRRVVDAWSERDGVCVVRNESTGGTQ